MKQIDAVYRVMDGPRVAAGPYLSEQEAKDWIVFALERYGSREYVIQKEAASSDETETMTITAEDVGVIDPSMLDEPAAP